MFGFENEGFEFVLWVIFEYFIVGNFFIFVECFGVFFL